MTACTLDPAPVQFCPWLFVVAAGGGCLGSMRNDISVGVQGWELHGLGFPVPCCCTRVLAPDSWLLSIYCTKPLEELVVFSLEKGSCVYLSI